MVGITEKDMLEKARMATVIMANNGASPAPTGSTFVGATSQRSGAWLLHMNTTTAATWLKAEMKFFLAAMGGTSSFKNRLFNVLVQFVPISLDPEREGNLRVVENDNSLPKGVLTKVHWVKPIHRRHEGQRVAHAIFGFNTPEAANTLIRDGAWVAGRKVYGRKLLAEPIRCLKCQGVGVGHIATNCPIAQDFCARCGEKHRTDTCAVTNDERACINCRNAKKPYHGHGAADRDCPIFQDKLQYSLERNHDAKYPYYLIENASDTWNTHEELTAALRRAGDKTTWKETQYNRTAHGPGPTAQEAAPIRERMVQGQNKGKRMFQPTMAEALARAKAPAQQSTPPDPRIHPSRVAQIQEANNQSPTAASTAGNAQRTPTPPAEQWTVEDEAALKEIEEEEASIAARNAALEARKPKWRACHPAGPTAFDFHDDGVEYIRGTEHSPARDKLPAISDDEDDIEIERTLAPGVQSSPTSVADRNA
jgi:hypothetical protein